MKQCAVIMVCVAPVWLAFAGEASEGAKASVAELVGMLPAATIENGKAIIGELVARGPSAVTEICAGLVPPGRGDDAAARFALEGIAYYAAGPDVLREEVRVAVSGALAGALKAQADDEIKAFLMRRLQICGAHEAVEALAPFLSHERLCDPAAQALVSIGTLTAAQALAGALEGAPNPQRVAILRALGDLRAHHHGPQVLAHAASQNREVREVALWALANMGEAGAAEALLGAARSEDRTERLRGGDMALLLARRLAERGEKGAARRIVQVVREIARARGDAHLVMACTHAGVAVEDGPGFEPLFNGVNLAGWLLNGKRLNGDANDPDGYFVNADGEIECKAAGGGKLLAGEQFDDVIFRFEFRLTPHANNGVGLRCPVEGDAAYNAIELQILDNPTYRIAPWQYHGSIYGVVPARRGFLRPTGEWNSQEVIADGRRITVTLNGTVILDADLDDAIANLPRVNPGHVGKHEDTLRNLVKGHIGFLGHGSQLWFRNIRIKKL